MAGSNRRAAYHCKSGIRLIDKITLKISELAYDCSPVLHKYEYLQDKSKHVQTNKCDSHVS